MSWTVRSVTLADTHTVARHRLPDLPPDHAAVRAYAEWLPSALERGLYLGWLAESGGGVVGGAGLILLEWGPTRDDPQPWRGRVVNVWTHPSWRRQGIARQLLMRVLAAAAARGVSVLGLSTTPAGRPLYGALGFEAATAEMVRRSSR
ncbi:GNAT family N-acetyltransferase [Deinococcus piscis]|uniref:GNAT family N-acetyltransferase n=1 Tax=Deinococcus piscis TaxID=394230 RepID=A0ABQ3K932_9DEIO|nr:GNAT family N-acetyltransferase [Deinococcus piscis]GHG08469.1 GNAT family N-acetyltransferase [Deinococcus piscis]